jgi:ankyrin repeat protein
MFVYDAIGATALHLMCSLGLKNIVEFFLRAGANPLIKVSYNCILKIECYVKHLG